MTKREKDSTKGEVTDLRVSNALVGAFLHYCALRDIDVDELLRPHGLSFASFRDVDGKVSERVYDLIFHLAEQRTQDVHFGLKFGRMFNLQHIGVLGYLLMNCETFEQSLEAYERFQENLGETISIRHVVAGPAVRVHVELFGGEKSGRHRVEAFVSSFVAAGMQLTGRPLQLTSWTTPFGPQGSLATYSQTVECIPSRSSEALLVFDQSYLNQPVINPVPEMHELFETNLVAAHAQNSVGEFTRRVRRLLVRRVGRDRIDGLGAIASLLGMSERSLQLKLEQEGVRFRDLLEQSQLAFATRFLQAGSPIAEISYALGFSEPSAFQRAFKRWTGQTPAQFRSLAGSASSD